MDHKLSLGEQASLLAFASAETVTRIRANDDAIDIVGFRFDNFDLPWWSCLPVIGDRRWNAYAKLYHAVAYLYVRHQQILLNGE